MIGPNEAAGGASADEVAYFVEWSDAAKQFVISPVADAYRANVVALMKNTPRDWRPLACFASKEAATEYARTLAWLKAEIGG